MPINILFFTLVQEHGSSLIPLEEIGEKYFSWSKKTIKSKFLSGELERLGLRAFQCANNQKAPVLVHVSDLANFLIKKRQLSISN